MADSRFQTENVQYENVVPVSNEAIKDHHGHIKKHSEGIFKKFSKIG